MASSSVSNAPSAVSTSSSVSYLALDPLSVRDESERGDGVQQPLDALHRYVTLDSLPEATLVAWYERYGFIKNIGENKARRIIKMAGAINTRTRSLRRSTSRISACVDIVLKREAGDPSARASL